LSAAASPVQNPAFQPSNRKKRKKEQKPEVFGPLINNSDRIKQTITMVYNSFQNRKS
jgi:hypothetical protein